jgi:hypothetical protein
VEADQEVTSAEAPAEPLAALVVDRKAEAAKLIRLARVASASTPYLKETSEQEIA